LNIRLGNYDAQRPPKTTALGLLYYPYGLDDFGKNKVRKACNRMTEAGVEPYIIAEIREWVPRLPAELPIWIDAAWTARMKAWTACVGSRLPNGKEITQGTLNKCAVNPPRVVLHPEPFLVPQGVKTAGAAYKDRIEIVIAYLDANNTWLRKCDDLIAWELGNWLGIQFDYRPQDVSKEIGNRAPC